MAPPFLRLLALEGRAIQPTWTAGPTLYVGRPAGIRAHATIQTVAGSPVAQVVFKWQGTKDASDPAGWTDVASHRDDNGVAELEHTYAGVAGAPAAYSFFVDARGFTALRLLAKSASGTGQDGDTATADGLTW